jgi:hypothetical protein
MKRICHLVFLGLLILFAANGCGDGDTLDSDNDGLSNSDELYIYGTDPYNADSDGDGRGDGEEVLSGTDPLVADQARSLTLNNAATNDVTVYIAFLGGMTGNGGNYTVQDFQSQGCDVYGSDRCSLAIAKGTSKILNLNKGCINLSGGLDHEPMGPCPTTMFEINICPPDNKTHDHFDLSLVNGFNYAMEIFSSTGIATRYVTTATGNHDAFGVFPLGCTQCIGQGSNPPGWSACPGNAASCGSQCFDTNECKSGPDELHPNIACDLEAVTGGSYTVNFADPSL